MTMKLFTLVLVSAMVGSLAFSPSPMATKQITTQLSMGYVPDGMSPEQYKRMKDKERKQQASKKFGAFGPQTFQSRSMQSFQKDLEKGKASHLMPMFNAKEKLKRGQIKQEDIPYMQRGGAWDNSDVKGAKKKSWNRTDQTYQANAAPTGVDWTGGRQRRGPTAAAAKKKQQQQQQQAPPKKMFGLF